MYNGKYSREEFDRLIERHRGLVEFLCRRASYGRAEYSADLVQECYVTLLDGMERRKAGMSEMKERAWVYWQCRGAITRYWRGEQRYLRMLIDKGEHGDATSTHEVTALTAEDLMSCLEEKERRCFLLMAAGRSEKEIEKELGLKHRSLVQMRHNIRKKIQEYLKQ